MLKNSQIQSIMMVLGVGGTALAGHLEARRQRRFRVIGRVLDFVADIPPMEIFPSLLHVAGQVSTANPDAWRSLLHDLASISQERFDLKVIEASMHGMMLAMQNVETDAGQAPDKSGAAHANSGATAAECAERELGQLDRRLAEVQRHLDNAIANAATEEASIREALAAQRRDAQQERQILLAERAQLSEQFAEDRRRMHEDAAAARLRHHQDIEALQTTKDLLAEAFKRTGLLEDSMQKQLMQALANAEQIKTRTECEAIHRLEDKLGDVLRELADERRRPVAPTNSGEVIATTDLRETVAVKEVIEEALKGMAQALATICKGPPVQQDNASGELGELRSQLVRDE